MDVHPNPVALDRELPHVKVIRTRLRHMMPEQIADFFAVVRMDGTHGAAALQTDEVLLRPLHHLGELMRTPDRVIGAIILNAHHHRVVVERLEQPFIEARFEIQHENHSVSIALVCCGFISQA